MARQPRKKPEKHIVVKDRTPESAWERQVGETGLCWEAFRTYRDMPPGERTLLKLVPIFGKCRTNFQRWSSEWDWMARCQAYDSWKDRQVRLAEIAAVRDMKTRHIQMAMSLQGAAALALNKIIAAERAGTQLTLKPNEVKELAELGLKIERLNRGEPSEIEVAKIEMVRPHVVTDYSALDLQELRTLRQLTRKARNSGDD